MSSSESGWNGQTPPPLPPLHTWPPMPVNPPLSEPTSPLSRSTHWWLRLTSSGPYGERRTFAERQSARRSDFLAWIVLGLLVLDVLVALISISDPGAHMGYLIFAVAAVPILVLNRFWHVSLAGTLLSFLLSGLFLGETIFSPHGLTLGKLPNYDCMVMGVMVAAFTLPRGWVFAFASLNVAGIVLDYRFEPHYMNIADSLSLFPNAWDQTVSFLIRPVILHAAVAVMCYLFVRSMDLTLRRAEREADSAEKYRQTLASHVEFELGVRQVAMALNRMASGEPNVRMPDLRLMKLHEMREDLNKIATTLDEQHDVPTRLRLTEEAVSQVASAVHDWRVGISPLLPPFPSGTSVDAIIAELNEVSRRTSGGPMSHQTP